MDTEPPPPERLAEVLRLCTLLADRALDAQIMGRLVPPEQVAALAKAAQLLHAHGVEWPPLLAQMIHDLAKDATEPEEAIAVPPASTPTPNALGETDMEGLKRFFAGFGKKNKQP